MIESLDDLRRFLEAKRASEAQAALAQPSAQPSEDAITAAYREAWFPELAGEAEPVTASLGQAGPTAAEDWAAFRAGPMGSINRV
jgi:hypothetical protein